MGLGGAADAGNRSSSLKLLELRELDTTTKLPLVRSMPHIKFDGTLRPMQRKTHAGHLLAHRSRSVIHWATKC